VRRGRGSGNQPKTLPWEGYGYFLEKHKYTTKFEEIKEYEYKKTKYFQDIS